MKQYYEILSNVPKPFIKWAGGKRQILSQLKKYMPIRTKTYFEPFLGGGALFFSLLQNNNNAKFYVSDLNYDLMLCYMTIRDNINELIPALENHSFSYFLSPKSYYYSVRDSNPKNKIDRVSRLLFLNKTCYNGLYRVNKNGKFNVPLGRYSNPNIINKNNLILISKLLQQNSVCIKYHDFFDILKIAQKDDFIYFDPPYQPLNKTSSFTNYTNRNFTYYDLKRLHDLAIKLTHRGCRIMLSNSKTTEVLDLFSSPYWKIIEISTNRLINSNPTKRYNHSEVLILNY